MCHHEPSPELKAYQETRTLQLAAGATLATVVENADVDHPQIATALGIYKDRAAAHDAAFEKLIEKDREAAALERTIDASIAAVRAEQGLEP